MPTARTILESLVVNKTSTATTVATTITAKEIKLQLEKRGYEVAEQVGQSGFKCSLAVKLKTGDEDYTLGILMDDDKHYSNSNLVEQYYQRPAILQSFGWRSINVFAKDWLQQPEKVIEQIIKRIKEEPVMELPEEENETSVIVETVKELPIVPVEETKPVNQPVIIPGFEGLQFERVEFTDAISNKFWEAATQENKLIIRFGRIGTKGQVQLKSFENTEKAIKEKEKMLREKLGKGYMPV